MAVTVAVELEVHLGDMTRAHLDVLAVTADPFLLRGHDVVAVRDLPKLELTVPIRVGPAGMAVVVGPVQDYVSIGDGVPVRIDHGARDGSGSVVIFVGVRTRKIRREGDSHHRRHGEDGPHDLLPFLELEFPLGISRETIQTDGAGSLALCDPLG